MYFAIYVTQSVAANYTCLRYRLFGDELDTTFWTVALHYLRAEKASPHTKVSQTLTKVSQAVTAVECCLTILTYLILFVFFHTPC